MSGLPKEATQVHMRLLKCALEVEGARAYWEQSDGSSATVQRAFDEYWFGARSLARVDMLIGNMRARYDAFPPSLAVLRRWQQLSPDTRRLICHWHLQLADPLYRAFTGQFLIERRSLSRAEVTRDSVVSWLREHGPAQWTIPTQIKFASNLLSAALSAGLLASNRDPRPVVLPRVPDDSIEYLMYLLRGIEFEGTLLQNPYAESVGLDSTFLEERLRTLPGLSFRRQGDLLDFGWRYENILRWADANLGSGELAGGVR